jgi:ABC-type nitrate/sulfonate/bicarbonate transport system substrate-binding protein
MVELKFSLLRGICQMPAYVAHEKGFFEQNGIRADLDIAATAWLIPQKLASGQSQFSVMPWTRVAAAEEEGLGLVLLAGSGCEEAAIVLRTGVAVDQVRKVAVPQRGGIKDLTAMGLIESLGWKDVELMRQPSGDGAILALVGQGADAASMVEPYATMLESLGIGTVIRRTADLWPHSPGCSLTTNVRMIREAPELVESVVSAFCRGSQYVEENPAEASEIASHYIGVSAAFIRKALNHNRPNVAALRARAAMDDILRLMLQLDYIRQLPSNYMNLSFLDRVTGRAGTAA